MNKVKDVYIKKNMILNLFLLILFKIVLEISYVFYINPVSEYFGFTLSLNYVKLIESYVFLIVIFFLIPKKEYKPSSIILMYLFLVMIIPLQSIYALKDEARGYFYLVMLGFLILILINRLFPKIKLPKVKHANLLLYTFMILIALTTYILMIRANGFPSLQALNLSQVYEVRKDVQYNSSIVVYLLNWQTKVVNAFLLGVFFQKKKYKLMLIPIAMQLFLFLMTGQKTFLFSLVLVIGGIYFIQNGKFFSLAIRGLLAGSTGALILALSKINIWPAALLTSRVLFLPAQISFNYYDYFSKNKLMYFAEGQIGRLFGIISPYSMRSPYLIGEAYYNAPTMHTNTGYIADAYMNFGAIGVIVFSLFFGFILLLIDSISARRNLAISMSVLIFPAASLVDSALLTTLLTHGLLISIVLILLYSNKEEGNKEESNKEESNKEESNKEKSKKKNCVKQI